MNTNSTAQHEKRLMLILSITAGLGFIAWTLYLAELSVSAIAFLILSCGWVALPYGLLAMIAYSSCNLRLSRIFWFVCFLLVTVFGYWMFDTIDEDAQGPLMIIFGPFYQVVAIVPFAGMIFLSDFILRQRKQSG